MDIDDQWICECSGIVMWCYVDKGVVFLDLGVEVVCVVFDDVGVGVDEVDYIVCVMMMLDYYFLGFGILLQFKFGLDMVLSFDLCQQCVGFVYGLQMVDVFICFGIVCIVLFVGCDVYICFMLFLDCIWELIYSDIDEWFDDEEEFVWNSCFCYLFVFFGDVVGVMVFCVNDSGDGCGIVGYELYGDGDNVEIFYLLGFGFVNWFIVMLDFYGIGEWVLVMEGCLVFKFVVMCMLKVIKSVLEMYGYLFDDFDLFVMYQVNLCINEVVQKVFRFFDECVYNNIQEYGNMMLVMLLLCFYEVCEQGKVFDGLFVVFIVFGVGMYWGSVLLQFQV